jgi:hypothetical protein
LLLAIAAIAGLALSIFAYFESVAVGYTDGVLLVIGSTALLTLGALAHALLLGLPRWLRALLDVLLLVGVIGTGVAAWFLEVRVLIAFMAVALVGWFVHVLFGPATPRPSQATLPAGP